ncbi:hypothetical protein GCM10025867_50610 (plasmid) [Frondihabitans sucicola]|uniref:Uncharacterized protein n=1 Tax=Frondihabitans sucicola TaxID=1268041 RepID=A0ABM8GWF6_9MICO|nr:hypothetical protein [Frondihabitans sucicola]BDZ52820.1 hypothetical protein GCM10025867_50610 [Frondihabitans sucicola]
MSGTLTVVSASIIVHTSPDTEAGRQEAQHVYRMTARKHPDKLVQLKLARPDRSVALIAFNQQPSVDFDLTQSDIRLLTLALNVLNNAIANPAYAPWAPLAANEAVDPLASREGTTAAIDRLAAGFEGIRFTQPPATLAPAHPRS